MANNFLIGPDGKEIQLSPGDIAAMGESKPSNSSSQQSPNQTNYVPPKQETVKETKPQDLVTGEEGNWYVGDTPLSIRPEHLTPGDISVLTAEEDPKFMQNLRDQGLLDNYDNRRGGVGSNGSGGNKQTYQSTQSSQQLPYEQYDTPYSEELESLIGEYRGMIDDLKQVPVVTPEMQELVDTYIGMLAEQPNLQTEDMGRIMDIIMQRAETPGVAVTPEMEALYERMLTMIDEPLQDVTETEAYGQVESSLQAQGLQASKDASRRILETMNQRGILSSTMTPDQLAGMEADIQQNITSTLAALIPQLQQQQFQERQSGIANVGGLLNTQSGFNTAQNILNQQQTSTLADIYGMQGVVQQGENQQYQQKLDGILNMLGFEGGVQSQAFNQAAQSAGGMQNLLNVIMGAEQEQYNRGLTAQEMESYNLLQTEKMGLEQSMQEFDQAMELFEAEGTASNAVAAILGIAPGSVFSDHAVKMRQIGNTYATQMARIIEDARQFEEKMEQDKYEFEFDAEQELLDKEQEIEAQNLDAEQEALIKGTYTAFYSEMGKSPEDAQAWLDNYRDNIIADFGVDVYEDMKRIYDKSTKSDPAQALMDYLNQN